MKIEDIEVGKVYCVCFPDDDQRYAKVIVKEEKRVIVQFSNDRAVAVDPRVILEL